MNELQQDIKHQLVTATENNRQHLENVFMPLVANAPSLAARFDEIDGVLEITDSVSAAAKVLLADFSKMRNSVKRAKDAEKKDFIAGGKVVQKIHNLIVVDQIEPMEARLKDIMNYEVIQRHKKVIETGEARQKQLVDIFNKYNYPPSANPLTIEELGMMPAEVWFTQLAGTESQIVEIRELEAKERQRQADEKKVETDRQAVRDLEFEALRKKNDELEAKAKEAEHQASIAPDATACTDANASSDREKIKDWADNISNVIHDTSPIIQDRKLQENMSNKSRIIIEVLLNLSHEMEEKQ